MKKFLLTLLNLLFLSVKSISEKLYVQKSTFTSILVKNIQLICERVWKMSLKGFLFSRTVGKKEQFIDTYVHNGTFYFSFGYISCIGI